MTIDVSVEVIVEDVATPSLAVSNRVEPLFATIPLTPLQIGVGQEIILISNTPHALKIFATPTTTFVETHV